MHIKECPIPERKIVTERRDAATRDKQSYLSGDMHTCFLVPLIRNLLALVQALPRNVVEFNQTPITKNVTHPFDGDPSKLRINLGGIYNCSWILNTVAIAGTGGYYLSQGAFALQINDEVLPDRPQHYGGYALPIEANPNVVRPQLVGQDLVRLKTGDIVQLRLVKAFPDPTIIDEGLVVNLTQSFQGQSNPNFNCVGADLILERIDS